MPIKQFVTGLDGKEFEIDDDKLGTEQTCQKCGIPIARRETTGQVTVDALRYMGSTKLAVVVPTGTPDVNPKVIRREVSFELCHPCAAPLLDPLGLVPEEAAAAAAAEPIEHRGADVEEHQGDELAAAAADVDELAAAPTRTVAILGHDGRDSGFTAFETGESVRYIDSSGKPIEETAMRDELARRAAAAAEQEAMHAGAGVG